MTIGGTELYPTAESMYVKAGSEEEQISRVVVRLNPRTMGIVFGVLCGIFLFLATNFLVLKGGPNQGAHLGLLSQYFPGYDVTFSGSIIGSVYAFIVGFLSGELLGTVYNKLAK